MLLGPCHTNNCPMAFCTSFPFQGQNCSRKLSLESFHFRTTASRNKYQRYGKRGLVPLFCHAGNGISQNHSSEKSKDPKKPASEFDLPSNPSTAKQRLLNLLTTFINDDGQITKVETLIRLLESMNHPVATESFTETALAGSWKLLFSSARGRTTGNVRIRRIGQKVLPEKKFIVNHALWSFRATPEQDEINATFDVDCLYTFVGPSRLKLEVQEHKVQILDRADGKPNHLPSDMSAVLAELRLGLPFEFFDPSGLIDVSYIEPNFRVARFMGKRVSGVRNVFIRNDWHTIQITCHANILLVRVWWRHCLCTILLAAGFYRDLGRLQQKHDSCSASKPTTSRKLLLPSSIPEQNGDLPVVFREIRFDRMIKNAITCDKLVILKMWTRTASTCFQVSLKKGTTFSIQIKIRILWR